MTLPGSMSTSFAIANMTKKRCVICRENVADLIYNVKRRYDSKHKKCFDCAYVGKDERMKEFKKRFDAYLVEMKRISVFTDTSSHLNEASYRICYLLARHQVPLTHAQLFKKAFMASAEVLFAGFQNKDKIVQHIGKLPLSPDTCARRCDELSGDIFMQLMTKLRACPAFSLALDESTDRSDTAQLMLMVSVRYFNEGVSDDFRCLIPLKGTTTAQDVCIALLKFGEENDLTWENLCVRESRLWSAGYDVNCCREREPYPRTFSQPQEVPKHLAALDDAEFGDVLIYNSVR